MSAAREAFALPVLFLTIAFLAGFRLASRVLLVPPSLTALILAVILMGVLVRAGAIRPPALLHGTRTALENMSGAVVLVTLFAATAQTLNLLIPDTGLLHAVFGIFLFCQLLTMGAARSDRVGSLRSLAVLLGSLFVLRFILLEGLYASDSSTLNRLLRTLMSGATLGGITYTPNAPATGYVAFFTLALYVIGLLLLPYEISLPPVPQRGAVQGSIVKSPLLMVLAATLMLSGCRKPEEPRKTSPAPAMPDVVTAEQRAAALRSARVWEPPAVPIGKAKLGSNPPGPGALRENDVVECKLVIKAMSGTTPKFDCERSPTDVIRVKYGRGNPELHAEIAATRLLSSMGFGADRMYVVSKVRCAGCPAFPFQALKCLAETGLQSACFVGGVDYSSAQDFEHVSIERRMEGRRIEAVADQGWAFFEIDKIEEQAGGSPRAHVDALKLLAVLIAHWDNKAENQRLICLPGGDRPDGSCARPLAILQDLGASFGPTKLDLHNWRARGVWADPKRCLVTMKDLPWGGATFPEQRISEAGRTFLLSLLEQLSTEQVQDLFTGARVGLSEGVTAESRQPAAWASAFEDKVRQVREAGPCQ